MDFFKRPRYHAVPDHLESRDVPENLFFKCTKCRELNYIKEFEKSFKVCSKCGHHFALTARERLALLLDEGSLEEIATGLRSADPLHFVEGTRTYTEEILRRQRETGLEDAVVCGRGLLGGFPIVISVLDFGFSGGTMGSVVGEKLTRAIETAVEERRPFVTVAASGGARMQEGILSLMQMAKTVAALPLLGARRLPYISILTDPTHGGVMASFAGLGDVIIAEPGARIGFAGPRVIEQTTRQKLPADFQSAEKVLEHGMIDMVVPRRDLKEMVARVLALHPNGAG